MQPTRPALAMLVAVFTVACTQLPDIADSISEQGRAAPWPSLQPVDGLIRRTAGANAAQDDLEQLARRAGSLKARAARLRGPVLAASERRRLIAAVERRS